MEKKTYYELMFNKVHPSDAGKTFLLKNTSDDDQVDLKKIRAAYKKAHEIRQFEIELSWKRATYFWAFELVVLSGLGALFSKYIDISVCIVKARQCLIALTTISLGGFFITLLWLFVILGSKSWQENWERHIDILEHHVSGNLYKCMLLSNAAHFSVSKASRNISILFLIFWFLCSSYFFLLTINMLGLENCKVLFVIIYLSTLLGITLLLFNKSRGNPQKQPQSARTISMRGLPY